MNASFKKTALLGLAVIAGLSGLLAQQADAHGVGYSESTLKPVSLEFFYSTGELLNYLEAKVFSPADEKIAYQSGRTDEGGRFAFTPNKPGTWRVIVSDEDGHRAEATVNVTEDFLKAGATGGGSGIDIQEKKAAPEGLDLLLRAGLGVSLIFNIAAFVLLLRCRKAV